MNSKTTPLSLVITLLLGLGHGTGSQARETTAAMSADAFDQALAADYAALARAESAQGDARDADTYAARADAALHGNPTAPDDPVARNAFLKDWYLADLSAGRERLIAALHGTARTDAPAALARAQSSFDCWLEQAAEDLQPADIEACRSAYLAAISEVERPPVPVAEPSAAAVAPPAVAADTPRDRYRLFFDFDRAEITAESAAVLDALSAEVAGNAVTEILISGHTSTAGTSTYNQQLSQRRAEAVKMRLLEMGVKTENLVTEARGETDLLVPTGDDIREPQNRRVEITLKR